MVICTAQCSKLIMFPNNLQLGSARKLKKSLISRYQNLYSKFDVFKNGQFSGSSIGDKDHRGRFQSVQGRFQVKRRENKVPAAWGNGSLSLNFYTLDLLLDNSQQSNLLFFHHNSVYFTFHCSSPALHTPVQVSKLDVALKVAQEGLQKVRTSADDKVERSLIKAFFTQYITAPGTTTSLYFYNLV